MTIRPVDYDVLTDRVAALETVVRKLIQHLVLADVMSEDLRSQIVDSLIDVATGDAGAEAQATRWARDLEGTGYRP